MFEVGKVFKKNGKDYCVLDILDYNYKKYLLLSEKGEKISFDFYEITMPDNNNYELVMVNDANLNNSLFELFENRNSKGEI